MNRALRYITIAAILVLSTLKLNAQVPLYDPVTGEVYQAIGEQTDYRTAEEIAADEAAQDRGKDTTKKEKVRKPLLSYYFDDSTRYENKYFMWRVNTKYNSVSLAPIDTLLNGEFQLDYDFMEIDGGIGSAYLGNLGGANIPLNYFSRGVSENFAFVDAWRSYIKMPEDVSFYNTRLPYSRLDFEMSGSTSVEENLFGILLSHNITPSTNVNVDYSSEGTKGQYINQKALTWNLALSASHTGKRWAIHGGYLYNGGDITENGGIVNDSYILDTLIDNPNQIDVMLNDATTTYRGNTVWWTASYAIPLRSLKEDEITIEKVPSIFIGNSFNYSAFKKSYIAAGDTTLYPDWNIRADSTTDSVTQHMLDTRFFIQFQPYDRNGVIGLISAGIGNNFSTYSQNIPEEYQTEWDFANETKNTTYLYGDIYGKISKYVTWNADAKLNLIGYRAGDLDVGGNIALSLYDKKQRPISLTGGVRFQTTEPDYWVQNYFSNHFAWVNDFDKEISTKIEAKFSVTPFNLFIGAEYEMTTNKIYYDSLMLPQQFKDPLSVLGIYAQKDFKFGIVNLDHRVLFQLASNEEVVPVPTLSAYISYYLGFDVVKNVLDVEVGVNGRYQTEYYGFGYNPALGVFYNQRETEQGGFPYMDAFVSAKWKRMKILVKLQNWNVGLFGGRNYFMVAHYPQNPMMLKFRFSWWFYD